MIHGEFYKHKNEEEKQYIESVPYSRKTTYMRNMRNHNIDFDFVMFKTYIEWRRINPSMDKTDDYYQALYGDDWRKQWVYQKRKQDKKGIYDGFSDAEILYVKEQNYQIYKYMKDMRNHGITFSIDKHKIYIEWRNDHRADSSSLKSYTIKYGEEFGKELHKIKIKKCTMDKKWYIEKYGEELGEEKYQERSKNISDSAKSYRVMHGEEKYQELLLKKSMSKDGFIRRYGKYKGIEKFNDFCRRNAYTNTIEYYIETHGEELGKKKHLEWRSDCGIPTRAEYFMDDDTDYEEACLKLGERQATFSLKKCIETHGDVKGIEVFEDRQQRWQQTLDDKPQEEKDRINMTKRPTL